MVRLELQRRWVKWRAPLPLCAVLPVLALGVCSLPYAPGCTPDANLPQGEDLLGVSIITESLTSAVFIDRSGDSRFLPHYTLWMLSTYGSCRSIPEEDVRMLLEVWTSVDPELSDPRSALRPKGFLSINSLAHGRHQRFVFRPGAPHPRPEVQHAMEVTLRIVAATYGDRFVRELRGAGLEGLFAEPKPAPRAPGGTGFVGAGGDLPLLPRSRHAERVRDRAGAHPRAEVPDFIESQGPSRQAPAWVSAQVGTTSSGLNPDFFTPHEIESLEGAVSAERGSAAETGSATGASPLECSRWTVTTIEWEDPRPNRSLSALVANAKAVYSGTVRDAEQGFYLGVPGTLLEVEVTQEIKYPGADPPETVMVFHPFAKIPVGDGLICARGERGEEAPEVGSRILVFGYRTVGRDATDVIRPDDEELIFERADGSLSLPRRVEDLSPDLTFDEAVSAAEQLRGKGSLR